MLKSGGERLVARGSRLSRFIRIVALNPLGLGTYGSELLIDKKLSLLNGCFRRLLGANDFSTRNLALPGTIFGVPEIVPGINVKEIISTVKFGINYRFGPY